MNQITIAIRAAYRHDQDPRLEVLMMAYAYPGGPEVGHAKATVRDITESKALTQRLSDDAGVFIAALHAPTGIGEPCFPVEAVADVFRISKGKR